VSRPENLPTADTVVLHLGQLATCGGPAPRRGGAQGAVEIVENGALAIGGGRILFAGKTADLERHVTIGPTTAVFDIPHLSAVPGFVDPHTHAVFAGDRRSELRQRLAGATYAQIAAAGGGIVSTVRASRAASERELIAQTRPRLEEMITCGTTTCEVKSGYGLDLESELKMLSAIRQLADDVPIDLVATFMGAHEIPVEYRSRRDEYVGLVVDRMIPEVASRNLAQWCDVFCETGVFTPAESLRILEAGTRAGLKPRIHADELGPSGGSQVAAQVGARSADHLVHIDAAGMAALAAGNVTATLLPCAAFYLKLGRFAPARALIEAGVPVALGTDVNPGGGFSPSMPFAMSLAAFAMNMTFEEALIAATINAAWSLDRADDVGSLEPGKLADVVFVRGELVNLIRVDADAIAAVMKRGRVVHGSMH
jgi:imidazolonepropionase